MCRNVALMWSGLIYWNSRIVLHRPVSSQAWNLTVAPLEIVLSPISTILSGTFGYRKVTGPLVKIPKFQDSVFVVSKRTAWKRKCSWFTEGPLGTSLGHCSQNTEPYSRAKYVEWTPHYLEILCGENSVHLPPLLPNPAPKCSLIHILH